jgi:hypothetical protein
MKILLLFKVPLLLLLMLSLPVAAQKVVEVEEPLELIRAELLVVQVPEAAALELQPELQDAAKVAGAQAKLLEMIKQKKAELIDWPTITGKPGNRMVVENIQEIKYPIEFEGPFTLPDPVDPAVTTVPTPTAPDVDAGKKKEEFIGGVPTTFETRNVGVTLEVEANLQPGEKTIDAQFAAQHVVLNGYRKEKMEIAGKHPVVVEQPEFHNRKTVTNLVFQSGVPQMVGFHKLKQPAGKVEIFLVTMTVIEMGKRKALREEK